MPSIMFGIPPDSGPTANYDEELLYRRLHQQMERMERAHEEATEEERHHRINAGDSHTVTLRMPTELLNRLDAIAKEDATTRSHVLRQITAFFVNYIYDNPVNEDSELRGIQLYDLAMNIVLKEQRASVSLIQRHLRIGFGRAQLLINELEERGVVTPPDKNGVRGVVWQQGSDHLNNVSRNSRTDEL